jgi:membrane protein implicated in regulation of membrane protease activity
MSLRRTPERTSREESPMRRFVYLALRALSALQHFLRERLTKAGWLALGAAAAAAVVGVDTNLAMSFQAFTFLASLLAVALLVAPFFRARVAVRRDLPRYATAGERLEYPVTVENLGPRSLVGVTAIEALRDPNPRASAREALEPRRGASQRLFTAPAASARWQHGASRSRFRGAGPGHPAAALPGEARDRCASRRRTVRSAWCEGWCGPRRPRT